MMLATALAVSFFLVVATIALHYEALRQLSDLVPKLRIFPPMRMLAVVAGVFAAHLVQVLLYASAFAAMSRYGAGSLAGAVEGTFADYLYLSLTGYTTLGVGDVYPVGPMRLVFAVESLNGLLMIAWSASFTYVAMERFWVSHRKRRRR
jgi:hypothetical protein